MTQNNPNAPDESGEARLKKRKNAFWTFVALGILAAGVAGLTSGFITAEVEQGSIPAWVMFAVMAVTAVGFIWFSYRYYMKVDELDLMDNLWGNTFGLYAYVILVTGWMALELAGLSGPPQHWPILIATVAIALIAYTARRLGLR